jgi:hypothetical protein
MVKNSCILCILQEILPLVSSARSQLYKHGHSPKYYGYYFPSLA